MTKTTNTYTADTISLKFYLLITLNKLKIRTLVMHCTLTHSNDLHGQQNMVAPSSEY